MHRAIVRNVGDGEQRWFLGGGTHIWKAMAEETNGTMSVFEDQMSRGKLTPLHFHADFEESFYVIEGELLLSIDGTESVLSTGGFASIPRGIRHAFVVTSDRARVLTFITPASGQAFFLKASQPAEDSGIGPVDFDRLGAIAMETGATTIVGPPPFALAR